MAEKTQVQIEVQNQAALKALDVFQKKLLSLGQTGNKAGADLAKGIQKGLSGLNAKIANDFTRDFNKNIRETAKGSGDTFAKGFGQSLRQSLQPQLTQLRSDIEKATKGISGSVSVPSVGAGGSGFSSFGSSLIVLNQGLELAQKGFQVLQSVASQTINVLNRGQEVQNLSTAFNNLQSSVGRTDGLSKFREATSGLISDLDLFRSANQAVILGVDKGSESFLALTSDAIKLGRAMGIDAKASIDSLTIGIGRQSKLMLDNLGVIIDAEGAYQAYAQTVGKTAETLTDAEKKTAFYNAALKGIQESASLLPDVILGAGDAFTVLSNQAESSFNQFALGVTQSAELRNELLELAGAVGENDFTKLGDDVAYFISIVVGAINTIKELTNRFFDFGEGIQRIRTFLTFVGNVSGGQGLGQAASNAEALVKGIGQSSKEAAEGVSKLRGMLGELREKTQITNFLKETRAELEKVKASGSGVDTQLEAVFKKDRINGLNALLSEGGAKLKGMEAASRAAGAGVSTGLGDAAKAANKFKDEVENSITKLALFGRNDQEIEKVRLKASELGDQLFSGTISADDLRKAFLELAKEGVKAGLSVSESEGLVNETLKDQKQLKDDLVRQDKQRAAQLQEVFSDFQKTGTGIFRKTIDDVFGTNLIGDSLNSAGGDPKKLAESIGFNNQLEQIIAGVISSGLSDGLKDFGSGKLGASLGSTAGGLLGSFFGPVGAALGSEFGSFFGEELEKNIKEFGKNSKSTVDSLAFAVDTVFPGVGTAIAKGLNSLGIGNKDPFKEARSAFKDFLDFLGEETKGFNFFEGKDILGLKPELLESLKIPQDVLDSYDSLGQALSLSPQLAEIAEGLDGIGGQFGDILAINFEDIGGLNSLQLLLEGAGLSADEFAKSLEDAYFRGTLGAGEFLTQNTQIQDLFATGIPGAIGAVDVAFQNFVNTATNSGQQGQDSLRDMVAEAQQFAEANGFNITSLDDFSNLLVNKFGASVEQAAQLMSALEQQGIDTVDELLNINLLDTAGVVNNLQQVGFGFKDVGQGVQESIDKINEFKKTATQEVVTDWKIKVKVEGDAVPQEVATATGFKSISAPSLR